MKSKSRIDKRNYIYMINTYKTRWYTKRWYKNDQLHRDKDLPAFVWDNGDMSWYIDGELIRISMK